jgi:YD repeat-containing protein
MRRSLRECVVAVALLYLASVALAQSGPVQYVYDELGRLVGVIAANGDAAAYHYDAVGNLLSITRSTASQVSIIEFTPNGGSVGQVVTIYGTGFSATAGLNTVSFNGTAAAISTATTTTLVVTVPSGATTGTIAVTSPNGSATSGDPFTVAASGAPTISGFTPTIGVAGTAVTISGTNFDPTAGQTIPKFNGRVTDPTAVSATSISAPVPTARASGRIAVLTPAGKAVSVDDFIVPPSPYTATDVAVSGRIPFGTATTITVSTAGKIGLWLFDGSVGQRVSLRGTNGSSGQVVGCDHPVSLRRPDNTVQASACMESSGFMDTVTLLSADTFSLMHDPAGTATGSVTLTLYNVPADFTGTISAGGSAQTVSTTVPGQNAELTFAGVSGQRISLVGTNGMSGQVLGCDVNVSIVQPDGNVLATPTCMENSGFIDVKTLPAAGTYRIVVNPVDIATGSLTLTLHDVPADYSGSITPGGSAATVSTTTAGQNGALTFTGTAGQRISLVGSNGLSGQILGCDVNVSILNPDATVLAAATCMEGSGFIDVKTLPSSGTYTILVDPVSTATGSVTLTLYDVPADYTASITPGGSAVTASTTTQGQNAQLTFQGTAGQRVSLSGTNGMSGQIFFACDVHVTILNPGGSVLAPATCMEGSGFIDVRTLATSGTYTIVVDPASTATGSLTLTLHDVPADTTGTISIGGSAVDVPLSTPGQNGTLTFSGTSGQQVTVRMTGNTFGSLTVKVLKPDGTQLTATTSSAASFNLSTQTLPTTGTYTVVIDPASWNTGTVSITVTNP